MQHHVPGCAAWQAGAVASRHAVLNTCVWQAVPVQQSRMLLELVHV